MTHLRLRRRRHRRRRSVVHCWSARRWAGAELRWTVDGRLRLAWGPRGACCRADLRLGADEKWSSFLDLFSFSIRMCGGELASTRLEARGKLDSALPEEGLDDAGLAR